MMVDTVVLPLENRDLKLLHEDESPEKDWALRLMGMESTTESTLTY